MSKGVIKMLYLIVVIISFVTAIAAPPDTLWTKLIDQNTNEQVRYVHELDDGNIIFAGAYGIYNTPFRDLMVGKLDANGNQLWFETFGSDESEGFYEGCPTSDDAFVMAGYSSDDPDHSAFAFKVSNDGDSVWANEYTVAYGDIGSFSGVCELPGGDLLMAGNVTLTSGNRQGLLVRTNSSGDTLWTKHYGGPDLSIVRGQIIPTSDGYYLLVGEERVEADLRYNYWLLKVDADGNEIFSRTYGGEDIDRANEVTEMELGSYVLGGGSYSYGTAGGSDAWLLLVSPITGDSISSVIYGDERSESCHELLATPDGGVISSNGHFNAGTTYWDIWVTKTDYMGNMLWEFEMVADSNDHIIEMEQTADGGFIMGALTAGSGSVTYDAWVLRFTEDNLFELSLRPHYNTPHISRSPPGSSQTPLSMEFEYPTG